MADMPVVDDWDAYMDVTKVAALGKIDSDDFLVNRTFGTDLRIINTSEVGDVRNRCQEFVVRLVDAILSLHVAIFISVFNVFAVSCFWKETTVVLLDFLES